MTLHQTSHPQIVFAGGDLLGRESLSLFDGLLIFPGGFTGLRAKAADAVRNGLIPFPYRIHDMGIPGMDRESTDLSQVIKKDLDYLAEAGCRSIGIHAPNNMAEAKAAVRAAVRWLEKHSKDVDTLYFVDLADDYFNCFGLDSFGSDRGVCNPSPTEFEVYYENDLEKDLEDAVGPVVEGDGIRAFCVEKGDVIKKLKLRPHQPLDCSVGLFYATLLPQVVSKITRKMQDTNNFSKVSRLPRIDRTMGGDMAPYTILADTGMLPKGNVISEWMTLAKNEAPYFARVLKHHIIGGIQVVRKESAKQLSHFDGATIKAMCREFNDYLSNLEAALKSGSDMPNYYLPEEIRK